MHKKVIVLAIGDELDTALKNEQVRQLAKVLQFRKYCTTYHDDIINGVVSIIIDYWAGTDKMLPAIGDSTSRWAEVRAEVPQVTEWLQQIQLEQEQIGKAQEWCFDAGIVKLAEVIDLLEDEDEMNNLIDTMR